MLTIIYSDLVGFGVVDAPPFSTDVQLHGLALAQLADDKLREALGVPDGLTAEQAEVARLEGELDAAVAAGVIIDWRPYTRNMGYTVTDGSDYAWNTGYLYPRLEQARRAVEHVRTLTVPAPKPRDVEEMPCYDCAEELRTRGWHWVRCQEWAGYVRDSSALQIADAEPAEEIAAYRAAVRKARELDAEGKS